LLRGYVIKNKVYINEVRGVMDGRVR